MTTRPATVTLRFKDPQRQTSRTPTDSGGNNVYNVTVTVTDSRGRTDSVDVAVTVENVEEIGKVTLSNRQPEVGVAIRAMLTDPDDGVRDVTWQWATADQYHSCRRFDVRLDGHRRGKIGELHSRQRRHGQRA